MRTRSDRIVFGALLVLAGVAWALVVFVILRILGIFDLLSRMGV